MKISIDFKSIFLVSSLLLAGACGHSGHSDHDSHDHESEHHDHEAEGEEHDHEHDHEVESHKHEGEIKLSHKAAELAGLSLETVAAGDFNSVVKTGGRIQAPAGAKATVSARVSGIVSFNVPNLSVGSKVGAGQTLFSVSSRGTGQADEKAAAKIALDLARKELERGELLVKDNLISKKEYERLKADYAAALAAVEGMGVRGASGSVGASSPLAGYVTSILVTPGQYVAEGEPLATVSQTRRLHLRADVSERDWHRLSAISGARILVPGRGEEVIDLSGLNFKVVSSSMPDVTSSHYIPVFIEFDNPGDLHNGSVAEVWLLGTSRGGVVTVPLSALTEEQGHHYVFVEEHKDVYKRVPVETGVSDGERVEIVKGLAGGEKVVVEGVHSVRLAENSGKVPAGHSHNH